MRYLYILCANLWIYGAICVFMTFARLMKNISHGQRRFSLRFDVSACTLMFWFALWHFGSRFDILARVWMFCLVLWSFGSRFDVLVCALMLRLTLWHFGLRFDILECALTFQLALWRFGLRLFAQENKSKILSSKLFKILRATAPFTGKVFFSRVSATL